MINDIVNLQWKLCQVIFFKEMISCTLSPLSKKDGDFMGVMPWVMSMNHGG